AVKIDTNAPPTVDAGPDQYVPTPTTVASLDGTITDDGLPNPPGSVATLWEKVSGPGTVSFGNASLVDTSASFSIGGTYVLRLSANDGGPSSVSDTITIVVNAAPAVNAGADQILTNFANPAIL